MTERLELYKCNICGNLIEVILSGSGELVCCGEPMEKLAPQTNESETGEKHIPVFIKNTDDKIEVRVGSTLHPMSEEHYIQFVQTVSEDKSCAVLKYFKPGNEPVMELGDYASVCGAVAYCNIHGLWRGDK